MTWPYGRQAPNNRLMEFMDWKFPFPREYDDLKFLDIGSGEGANARELGKRGYVVMKLDIDPSTDPDICADICTANDPPWKLDGIFDVNTLCHVQNPPIDKIRSWLKPYGYFYCIAPDIETWQEHVRAGKDHTRLTNEYQLRALLNGFSEVIIHPHVYYLRGHEMKSWIAEARK